MASWSFATSLDTSVGRLPNHLDVRAGVGEDAQEWLIEVHCVCACSRHLLSVPLMQVPCICHGSGDDPKDGSIFDFCVRCGIEQQACCSGLCHHIFML
ncbi:hypothetical protein T08_9337 [Trichinella sp. T8]|nr:hypothetical protein T08_9337 [Trichinella sp. T8]